MKKVTLIITILLLAFTSHAQNAIAKINYEQAEEAFEKNDYALTLAKLDEAQKILGSTNPKILYLRLMATKAIMATGKFHWDILAEARANTAYYLKNYSEMAGIEEKLRQVYEFSEALEKYPKTKELYGQKLAQEEQARTEWLKKRPVQVSDSLMNTFGVNEFRTMDAFLSSRYASEFKKDKRFSTKYETWYDRKVTNYAPVGPWYFKFNYSGECSFYNYVILPKTADIAAAKRRFQFLLDLYPAELDKEWVERKEPTRGVLENMETVFMVKKPATGNKGHFDIYYKEFADGASIEVNIFP